MFYLLIDDDVDVARRLPKCLSRQATAIRGFTHPFEGQRVGKSPVKEDRFERCVYAGCFGIRSDERCFIG